MAKCIGCNSCLRVIRIDHEDQSYVVWYCPLEQRIFKLNNKYEELKDTTLLKETIEVYTKQYGSTID